MGGLPEDVLIFEDKPIEISTFLEKMSKKPQAFEHLLKELGRPEDSSIEHLLIEKIANNFSKTEIGYMAALYLSSGRWGAANKSDVRHTILKNIEFLDLFSALYGNPHDPALIEVAKLAAANAGEAAWGTALEMENDKGATPLYGLMRTLIKNPTNTNLIELAKLAAANAGEAAWGRILEVGNEKGGTPLYGLMGALFKNATDPNLCEAAKLAAANASGATWGTALEVGSWKGATPLHGLMGALSKNSTDANAALIEVAKLAAANAVGAA